MMSGLPTDFNDTSGFTLYGTLPENHTPKHLRHSMHDAYVRAWEARLGEAADLIRRENRNAIAIRRITEYAKVALFRRFEIQAEKNVHALGQHVNYGLKPENTSILIETLDNLYKYEVRDRVINLLTDENHHQRCLRKANALSDEWKQLYGHMEDASLLSDTPYHPAHPLLVQTVQNNQTAEKTLAQEIAEVESSIGDTKRRGFWFRRSKRDSTPPTATEPVEETVQPTVAIESVESKPVEETVQPTVAIESVESKPVEETVQPTVAIESVEEIVTTESETVQPTDATKSEPVQPTNATESVQPTDTTTDPSLTVSMIEVNDPPENTKQFTDQKTKNWLSWLW